MAGIVLQHNFIETHTTIKDYPCERARIKTEFGINRWLRLIKQSAEIVKDKNNT